MSGASTGRGIDYHRLSGAVVLAGFTFVLGVLLLTGRIRLYVNPSFIVYQLFALIVLAVIAFSQVCLVILGRNESCGEGCSCHAHQHEAPTRLRYILMLLPLCLAVAIPVEPMQTDLALKRGIMLGNVSGLTGKPSSDPFLRASEALYGGKMAEGDDIGLSGMLVRPEGPGGPIIICRFVVFCCIADAIPVGVTVVGKPLDGVENGTWVEVTGHCSGLSPEKKPPFVLVSSEKILPAETEPYIYP